MMEAVEPVLLWAAEAVDIIGLAICLIGAAKFLIVYTRVEVKRLAGHECASQIQAARRVLGSYILVALEFMIVSDVIGSVLSRTLESLASLGAIVVLRTAMGYFLERELRGDAEESRS